MTYGTRVSMLNSQGFSNNPYSEQTQFLVLTLISLRSILILPSHLRLGLPKGIFPLDLLAKILSALLSSSIPAKCPAHLNHIDNHPDHIR